MGERYPGNIEIGGDFPRDRLEELLEALRNSGGGSEWDIAFDGTTEESLKELYDGGTTLNIRDSQASYGGFSELEDFCKKNNLPYDAHCDSHYENSAQKTRWRPGMEWAVGVASDNDQTSLIDASEVVKARRHLSEGNVIAAVKTLDEVLVGVMLPALPPFRLT